MIALADIDVRDICVAYDASAEHWAEGVPTHALTDMFHRSAFELGGKEGLTYLREGGPLTMHVKLNEGYITVSVSGVALFKTRSAEVAA